MISTDLPALDESSLAPKDKAQAGVGVFHEITTIAAVALCFTNIYYTQGYKRWVQQHGIDYTLVRPETRLVKLGLWIESAVGLLHAPI